MKTSFLAIVVLFLYGCAPHMNVKPYTYPKPFQFTLIDSVSGTKDQLYVKANEWMAKTFVSSKSVIQMSDKEAGKIIGKAVIELPMQEGLYTHTDIVNYTISVDVKDGKYRCVLSDFYHEGGKGYGSKADASTYGSLENETAYVMGFNMTHSLWYIKNKAADQSKDILDKLKIAMQTKKDDF